MPRNLSHKAPTVLVLLLICSQLNQLVQSHTGVQASHGLADGDSNLQPAADHPKSRQLASATSAYAKRVARKSAELQVTTYGTQCRKKVFDSLAVAIENVLMAKTAPRRRRLVSVMKKTCRKGHGRVLLATQANSTVTYTFSTTTAGGDAAAMLNDTSTQQAISSSSSDSGIQVMSYDVTSSTGDTSPAPITPANPEIANTPDSSSSSSSVVTCGSTNSSVSGNQTYSDCSTVLAYWFQYNPAAAGVNITGLSALDAAEACCATDHPYGTPGATCSNLFAVADSASATAYSNSSCAQQLGKGWVVDDAAFDIQVDTAATENEVAKLCCTNGNLYPEYAACGDVIGDGSNYSYSTGLCNEQLANWYYYDVSKAAVVIDQVDSELEAAQLCCKTDSIYPLNATCGNLTGAPPQPDSASSTNSFPDNLCKQWLADDFYYDAAQAQTRVESYSSAGDAAKACCKTDSPRSLSGTCGDLDGNPNTIDPYTTAMCQAAFGSDTDWQYDVANSNLEVGQATTAKAMAILCCVNENPGLFPRNATCGNIDGDPATSNSFNTCTKYAGDIASPGGQLGGVMTFDASKAGVDLHGVMTEVEAASICCKEVYPEGATCGDMWPTFPGSSPFDGCDKQLKTDQLTLATQIAGKTHQEAADTCCMYKHRKLSWVHVV